MEHTRPAQSTETTTSPERYFRLWSPDTTAARVHVRRPHEQQDSSSSRGHSSSALYTSTSTESDDFTGDAATVIYPLHRTGEWWVSDIPAHPGDRYAFSITTDPAASDDTTSTKDSDAIEWVGPFPDPCSERQPDGVHGFSEIWEPTYEFNCTQWRGRPLEGSVLYELHVGTFTPEGTFDGLIEKLPYLKDLGVTTIELMPVAPFGGTRNWGYDGNNWFAVQESYGGPDGLRKLVDEAHQHGMAVCLDVVYNHFGPDGYYGGAFAPYTSGGSTGWGEVVNLVGDHSDTVRRLIMDAIRRWFTEFRIDALRLDAVHAFNDPGAHPILEQMNDVARDVTARTGIPRTLIAESDQNDPRIVSPVAAGGYGLAGQWCDDVHHAIHSAVSGEHHAYYGDFGSPQVLATALTRAFWHDGRYSQFRGRTHGRPIHHATQPASSFVTYTTTHDQTGNRAAGDRPSMNLTPEQQVTKAALVFTSPYTPMLFEGEEWGASTPFPFFASHESDELNELTKEGRKREFARAGWSDDAVPDPSAQSTFDSARLDWDELTEGSHQAIHDAYRKLIALREDFPLLRSGNFASISVSWHDDSGNPAAAAHGADVNASGALSTPPVVDESPGRGRWIRVDRFSPVTNTAVPTTGGNTASAQANGDNTISAFINLADEPADIPLPHGSEINDWNVIFRFGASEGEETSLATDTEATLEHSTEDKSVGNDEETRVKLAPWETIIVAL